MELLLEDITVKDILGKALKNSMSYETYRELVATLVEQESTTGVDKSEAMVNYTMLNDRRMKRWDKTIKVPQELEEAIGAYDQKITWLVISESWCGDAAHVLPVIKKVSDLNPTITLRIVLRDENPELMDAFLTNGGRSIPKLIMLNEELEVINTFGPRPSVATKMVEDYKAEHGSLTPEFKEGLQRWYNKDKGQSIIADLNALLN